MKMKFALSGMLSLGFVLVAGSAPVSSQEGTDNTESSSTEKAAEPSRGAPARVANPVKPPRVGKTGNVTKPRSAKVATPVAPSPVSPLPVAVQESAKPPSAEPKPETIKPENVTVNPAGEYQPVIHARRENITTCMDDIVTQSNEIIDRPHTAISTWVTSAPNNHAFGSLVGLSNSSKIAPNAAAVIFAAPLSASKCEGVSVQIYPTAQPCGTVQAGLIKAGRTIGSLQSMPIVDTNDGARNLLLPSGNGGCVLVRTRMRAS